MRKIFKSISLWAKQLLGIYDGVTTDVADITNDVVHTPISEAYIDEIEASEIEAVACLYYKDYELMAAFEASVTARSRGIDNIIPESVKPIIRALNRALLIPLTKGTGWQIKITSGFRSAALNSAVGGARTSQHLTGEAVDFRCYEPSGARIPILTMARKVKELNLPFDQMILYETFLHLSHRDNGGNRGQVLYHSSYTGQRL